MIKAGYFSLLLAMSAAVYTGAAAAQDSSDLPVCSATVHDHCVERERVYRGRNEVHRHQCGGGNGAVGTVAGGVGGGLIGDAVIGGPVGIVAGAVGGGLLGRHLDKVHSRHQNGC
jgi:hypothetical protein